MLGAFLLKLRNISGRRSVTGTSCLAYFFRV